MKKGYICAAIAVAAIGPALSSDLAETLVLQNDALRAEVSPAWGGRLMFFGRTGGKNALWTNPSASTNTCDSAGKAKWKNVGGEKTWVGAIGSDYWKGFSSDGRDWPPPAWFDSAPLDVVRADATNILLRSGFHSACGWTVALEREFTLTGDRLLLREKLCDCSQISNVHKSQMNTNDNCNLPFVYNDDLRRVWSVTQIPLVDRVEARLVGDGRAEYFVGCPPLSPPGSGGWAALDLSSAPKNARVTLDGDALAATIPGVGRLVIEQSAAARHLGAFGKPSRAIVYTTGKKAEPSKWTGSAQTGYIELEFTALGPDAEQTLSFRIEGFSRKEHKDRKEARLKRMREDKLGMFIHWGLYSIPAKGEWLMNRENIPATQYDRLADEFCPPASFSPREWVRLAKRAGCRYAVLTTRHHDGFCLFDTKTTDFNSVKTAAKRDFVREFADACREEGLRVGFYFSIMNWQYDHSPGGVFDRKVWDAQVRTTHEALRELMANYGRIDYLWYDGCSAPGSTDAEAMERMWRIKNLNAMVRSLQPDILINDRSSVPEDYSTPEQCLTPPPRGRMWESCITCNRNWGYVKDDADWKSTETLVRSLLHCARFGGNMLVNIGPRADGSVPEECVRAFEGLGDYVAGCPESIYGAERDDWTEATHEAGVVTKTKDGYWLHTFESFRHKESLSTNDNCHNCPQIANANLCDSAALREINRPALDNAAAMVKVADGVYRVAFKRNARPCNWLGGRHDVEVKPGEAPMLGEDSDREAPPAGELEIVGMCNIGNIPVSFPAGGIWKVEIGYVTPEGFKDTHSIDCTAEAGETKTFALPCGAKGVYAKRVSPAWKAVPPKSWDVAGVFPSRFYATGFDAKTVGEIFERDLLAEAEAAEFIPVGDENDKADKPDVRINLNYSAPVKRIGYAFARRKFSSDCERTVYAAFGADWWGEVFVNGEKALDVRSGWKPTPFPLRLKKGDNEVLVVVHGGSRQHWFVFYVNDEC